MKISIITVALNAEATIGDAIRSVAAQSYGEIEHLVIDGRSGDATLEEVERARHPRLSVVSEPDEGLYDALNKGILRSSGEVVGLVHADDTLAHPHVLAQVGAAFDDPEVDAVYGDLDYVARGETSRVIRHWRAGEFRPARLKRGWMPPHPTLYLRRRVFDALGLYDTRYKIAADYDAVLRFFGAGGVRAVYLPEVLVKMRAGGESNRDLGRILTKSREDLLALRRNSVGGWPTLLAKNFSKLPQFLVRQPLRPETGIITRGARRPAVSRPGSFAP